MTSEQLIARIQDAHQKNGVSYCWWPMSKYQACLSPEGSNFNASTSTLHCLHCHSFSLVWSPRLVELHPCGLAPCGDLQRAGGTTVEAAFGGGTTAVLDIGCHGGGHADTIGVGWWNGPGSLWMLGDAMQHCQHGRKHKGQTYKNEVTWGTMKVHQYLDLW